eukprot:3351904-Prymnesium_polylepis.1
MARWSTVGRARQTLHVDTRCSCAASRATRCATSLGERGKDPPGANRQSGRTAGCPAVPP